MAGMTLFEGKFASKLLKSFNSDKELHCRQDIFQFIESHIADDFDKVATLVQNTVRTNSAHFFMIEFLNLACEKNWEDIVDVLIQWKVEARRDNMSLAIAAKHGHLNIVKKLFSAVKNTSGDYAALRLAIENKRFEVVEFLLDSYGTIPLKANMGEELYNLIMSSNNAELLDILKRSEKFQFYARRSYRKKRFRDKRKTNIYRERYNGQARKVR